MDEREIPQTSERTGWSLRPEPSLSRFAAIAKRLVNAPTAWVLLDENHGNNGFSKSRTEFLDSPAHRQTDLVEIQSLCHRILTEAGPVLIHDSRGFTQMAARNVSQGAHLAAFLGIPIKGPERKVVGAFCVVDVEPRKWGDQEVGSLRGLGELIEEELAHRFRYQRVVEQANVRLNEFLSSVGHDMKSPLAAILSAVHLMRRTEVDEQDIEWSHGVIERQSNQLVHLIDDMLDVSRLALGKIQLRKERIHVAEVIERAVSRVRPVLERKSHELRVALDRATERFEADPARLEQIVVSLLRNAIKVSDHSGTIELTSVRSADAFSLSVSDSGAGISEDRLSNFFQSWLDPSSWSSGSQVVLGMNLTLVQGLAELHGGRVEVMSEGTGLGSRFTVHFPAPDLDHWEKSDARVKPIGASSTLKILVVDDNKDSARSMAMLLEISGHEVQLAFDGLAAVDAAIANCPDVLILDIGLPGRDGYAVARAVREEPACRDALMIAVSGYGQAEDQRRSVEAGFDAHLVKPVDLDELMKLLGRVRPMDGQASNG